MLGIWLFCLTPKPAKPLKKWSERHDLNMRPLPPQVYLSTITLVNYVNQGQNYVSHYLFDSSVSIV